MAKKSLMSCVVLFVPVQATYDQMVIS